MSFPIVLAISLLACVPLAWSWYRAAHPKVAPPAPPKPPEPLPELPISCFVKGLIASLETEPGAWVADYLYPEGCDFITYHKDGIDLGLACRTYSQGCGEEYTASIRTPVTSLNHTEQRELTTALTKAYHVQNAQKEAAREVEAAKLRAPFEALGCPKSP